MKDWIFTNTLIYCVLKRGVADMGTKREKIITHLEQPFESTSVFHLS